MRREQLTDEIKVRVPVWLKKALEDNALREDMVLSDVVRRALKSYALNQRPVAQAA
jgi:hypothetical protein